MGAQGEEHFVVDVVVVVGVMHVLCCSNSANMLAMFFSLPGTVPLLL